MDFETVRLARVGVWQLRWVGVLAHVAKAANPVVASLQRRGTSIVEALRGPR